MYKFFALLIILCSTSYVYPQTSIKEYVQQNTHKVTNIISNSTDYSDLEAFGNSIGNATVVMLGEQDHGDAPTFLAKTRLIRYLHEKKGFNVLAFESDFFGLNYHWESVKDGRLDLNGYIKNNIYPIWTYCDAMQDLFQQYIPATLKTKAPLELTGFDNQMGIKNLYPILDSMMRHLVLPITKQSDYEQTILPLLKSMGQFTKDSISNTNVNNYLNEIKSQFLTVLPDTSFWVLTLDNLIQFNLQLRNYRKSYWKDMNTRDRQMSANLNWLKKVKYANQKIIVWAHNYHVSKFSGQFPDDFMNVGWTMGSYFIQDTSNLNATYILGFTSFEGTAGMIGQKLYKVDKPKQNGFENWIDKSLEYAFIDFKRFNDESPNFSDNFYLSGAVKGNLTHKNDEARWNKVFDGIFYIKAMYSCKKIDFPLLTPAPSQEP